MAGGEIQLIGLAKSFGGVPAVTGIDLDIPAGEFFSLLGPSGCGKTTTLRMIAGFEKPTPGRIVLDGRDVGRDPPHQASGQHRLPELRAVPVHDVWDNVAFGLQLPEDRQGRDRAAGRRGARHWSDGALRQAPPGPAVRRPAAARRAGPRAGAAARGCCCSTSRSARWTPSCASLAARAAGRAARGRHHLRLRDPRPGGGPDDVRPDRGDGRRPGRAGRAARRRSTRRPATTYVAGFLGVGQHARRRRARSCADAAGGLLGAVHSLVAAVDGQLHAGPAAVVHPAGADRAARSATRRRRPDATCRRGIVERVVYLGAATQVTSRRRRPRALSSRCRTRPGPQLGGATSRERPSACVCTPATPCGCCTRSTRRR